MNAHEIRLLSVQGYLQEHPNATLAQYEEYLVDTQNEIQRQKKEEQANAANWFNDLIGRYFLLDHNGASYCYFKLAKANNGKFVSDGPSICLLYESGSLKQIKVDKEYWLNPIWFSNPYIKTYGTPGIRAIKEISKEEFDEVSEKVSKIRNLFPYFVVPAGQSI